MKNNLSAMLPAMAIFLSMCGFMLSGCEIVPGYESWGSDAAQLQTPTTTSTQTASAETLPAETLPAETPPAETPPYETGGQYDGAFVVGDKSVDHGQEVYGYAGGMDIRCLANDASKTPGAANNFYFISTEVINDTGALIIDGDTVTADNFTSPRSGKKYRWMGWTIEKSSAPLVTDNPLTLSGLHGTLRSYWATVE